MKFCRRLIVVPLSTFHCLAETIGDPKGELIFLFNTGRCGSTLLTQVHQENSDELFTISVKSVFHKRRHRRQQSHERLHYPPSHHLNNYQFAVKCVVGIKMVVQK